MGLHFAAAVGAVGFPCCFRKFLAAAELKTFDYKTADHVGLHFVPAVPAVGLSCGFHTGANVRLAIVIIIIIIIDFIYIAFISLTVLGTLQKMY